MGTIARKCHVKRSDSVGRDIRLVMEWDKRPFPSLGKDDRLFRHTAAGIFGIRKSLPLGTTWEQTTPKKG